MDIKKTCDIMPECERLSRKDKKGLVEKFEDCLKKLDVNKNNFYRNLKTLKIIRTKNMESGNAAEYNLLDNQIHVNEDYETTSMHELLHMSSTIIDGSRVYSGLFQADTNLDEIIGVGINEGLTAIIDKKHFSKENAKYTYLMCEYATSLLEAILGHEFLLESYFNADLYSLYKVLSAYIGEKGALRIIQTVDNIYYDIDSKTIPNLKKAKKYNKELLYYLSRISLYDVFDSFYENEISEEELDIKLDYIRSILESRVACGKIINSRIFKDDEIDKIINNSEMKVLKKHIRKD